MGLADLTWQQPQPQHSQNPAWVWREQLPELWDGRMELPGTGGHSQKAAGILQVHFKFIFGSKIPAVFLVLANTAVLERIPNPRERIPNPREKIPSPRERIPNPAGQNSQSSRREFPIHQERILNPRETIPSPGERIPNPRERIFNPRDKIPNQRERNSQSSRIS